MRDLAGHDQHRQQRVQHEAHEVGGDGDEVARQAVGETPPMSMKPISGTRYDAIDETEVGRAARELDDEQRHRDHDDAIAERLVAFASHSRRKLRWRRTRSCRAPGMP